MLQKLFAKCKAKLWRFSLFAITFCALPVYAQQDVKVTGLNAQSMLVRIAEQIPNLMSMTTAIAYVLGMYFMFYGILKLKQYGEARTQMSQDHSLKGPIILLSVGVFLLYLPTSVSVGMSTFWTEPNPYGYLQQQDEWSEFINVCFLIVQFVGTIAFIRGLVLLSHLNTSGQPGTFGRGLTHIIGGVFCINIYQFVHVVMATLGLNIET